MGGWLFTDGPGGVWTFLVFTVAIGGAAAWATGRAFAVTWRPAWTMAFPFLALAAAVRFLHYALSGEDLSSAYYYLVALVVVAAVGIYGYRARRVEQMTRQYPWLFARSGVLSWTPAAGDEGQA